MTRRARYRQSILYALMVFGAGLLLSGCGFGLGEMASTNIFQRNDVNLPQKNYAAADLLISQAQSNINNQTPIAVAPLNELLQPEISSAFGALVTEQVGVRLSQLGYNVQLDYVSAYTDLRPPKPQKPRVLVAGTYNPRRSDVSVSLRMVDLRSKRIIASFDYVLPLSEEIGDLIVPQPRVFRLAQ